MLRRGVEAVLNEGIFGLSQFKYAVPFPDRELEQLVGVKPGFFDPTKSLQLAKLKHSNNLSAIDLESGNVIDFHKRRNS
jgi:hypothetical protein